MKRINLITDLAVWLLLQNDFCHEFTVSLILLCNSTVFLCTP